MKISSTKSIVFSIALVAAGLGTAHASWFSIDTTYGTSGVSAPLATSTYSRSLAVDQNDSNHYAYSLIAAVSNTTNGYQGPFSIARRTSTGALDMTFGASGILTSFANSTAVYDFRGLCIDPLTHNLVVVGNINNGPSNSTTVIERLTPPGSNGSAALDTTFNPQGTTPGILTTNMIGGRSCSVAGDQSIIVHGYSNGLTPTQSAMARVRVDGTLDSAFGTNGIAMFAPPNGQNYEGAALIAWNSSQTINADIIVGGDTYPTGNQNATTQVLMAVNACTGAPDTNFNGNGFAIVPVIDTYTFGAIATLAIQNNGSVHAPLVVTTGTSTTSLNADLVGWNYPVTISQWIMPTAPGQVTFPSGISVINDGGDANPARQFDGSVLISGETASNQAVIFKLVGDATLGFTVGAPAPFSCGATVAVPNVVGQTQAAATTAITTAGLVLGAVTQQSSSTVASGSVISESPTAGTMVSTGSSVSLVVSSGPPVQVSVPNVVGQTQAAATTAITNAGLVLGTVTQQSSSTVAAGSVISESPAAGTMVNTGSSVNLVVSSGAPAQISVPNVVGQTQAAATTAITTAGLVLGTVTQQSSSTVTSGNVISESPAAGTMVSSGSSVSLVVSTGGGGGGGGGHGGGGALDAWALMALGALMWSRRYRPRA